MTMKSPELIMEKLRKIKSLAENGGTESEKAAAIKMLEMLVQKHGLTIEDLKINQVQRRTFTVSNADIGLWMHCLFTACGWPDDMPIWKPVRGKGKNTEKYVDLTDQQFFDTETLFDFYKSAWTKEVDIFFHAFLCKHNLAKPAESKNDKIDWDLILKLKSMQQAMSEHPNPLRKGLIGYEGELES